jgi:hypothetical protein
MMLTEHPRWPDLLPYIRLEVYDRDGGHTHPRHRLEVQTPPAALAKDLLTIVVDCAGCGTPMHPVRQRQAGTVHLYLAVACPLSVMLGCARSRAAAEAYEQIVAAVKGRVDPRQPVLFT